MVNIHTYSDPAIPLLGLHPLLNGHVFTKDECRDVKAALFVIIKTGNNLMSINSRRDN